MSIAKNSEEIIAQRDAFQKVADENVKILTKQANDRAYEEVNALVVKVANAVKGSEEPMFVTRYVLPIQHSSIGGLVFDVHFIPGSGELVENLQAYPKDIDPLDGHSTPGVLVGRLKYDPKGIKECGAVDYQRSVRAGLDGILASLESE